MRSKLSHFVPILCGLILLPVVLLELLRIQPMVALGRVVAMVPGWALDQAMTMVYVETEELLHCRENYGVVVKSWSATFSGHSLNSNKSCETEPSNVNQPTGPVAVQISCTCTGSTSTDCPYDFPPGLLPLTSLHIA